jgi:O-antigen ligase
MSNSPAPARLLLSVSACWLAGALWIAVLVMWVPARWINPSLFQTALLILLLGWGISLACRPFGVRLSPVLIPMLLAVGWGLLQIAAGHTIGPWNTWMAVLNWLVCLSAFFLALQVCSSQRVRQKFLSALLYFGFVLSVVSVVQYFSSNGKIFWFYEMYYGDLLGPFVNRDRYAAFIELLLPLAVVKAFAGGGRSWKFILMGAAMFASVIAGASRAGALLATAEVGAVLAAGWVKGRFSQERIGNVIAGFWVIAVIFTSVVGWVVLWNRFQDPDPFRGRREILSSTIAMVKARPCFGFGLGNFQTAYPAYALVDFGPVVNHAHNDWAQWAAEGGIPFALLPLGIAVWSVPKAFKTVWGIGVVAVFLHCLVDFPLQDPVIALWLFTLLGAIAAESTRAGIQQQATGG